jgi:hypothetical protein
MTRCKFWFKELLFLVLLFLFYGCLMPSTLEDNMKSAEIIKGNVENKPLPFALEDQYLEGDRLGLKTGEYELVFTKTSEESYGLVIMNNEELLFGQEEPIAMTVDSASARQIIGNSYNDLQKHPSGWQGMTTVKTEGGSEFKISDIWFIVEEGIFGLSRSVEILSVNALSAAEKGFSSSFVMNIGGSDASNDYDITLPALVYNDSSNLKSRWQPTIGHNLDVKELFVKETRMGMPFVLIREKLSGKSLTVLHYNPIIYSGLVGGGEPVVPNETIQYGSLGFIKEDDGLNAGFVYPCKEVPVGYQSSGLGSRFHPMKAGVPHEYKLALIPNKGSNKTDALVYAVKKTFKSDHAKPFESDSEYVYKTSLDLISNHFYFEQGIGAGPAYWLGVMDTTDVAYHWGMGWCGANTSLGYQLLLQGYLNNNEVWKRQGTRIMNFWTSDIAFPKTDNFPVTRWFSWGGTSGLSPYNDGVTYPVFLHDLCGGMEGILEAYKVSVKYGKPQKKWFETVERVASFLKDNQLADGSFYRAYDTQGRLNTMAEEPTYGSYGGLEGHRSKLSTGNAVPLLAKLSVYYVSAGDNAKASAYKDAALKAADFLYQEAYQGLGKYIGTLLDQPDIVDKESGIAALKAFTAAYFLSNDSKYIKAAEHAACYILTWVYIYDFAVNSVPSKDRFNVFKRGGISGFSQIGAGFSGGDVAASLASFDLYTVYLLAEDEIYKDMAIFVQNNSRQAADWNGSKKFLYRGMAPEGTYVSEFDYRTVNEPGFTLAWIPNCFIRPMTDAYNVFGVKDLRMISGSVGQQRVVLEEKYLK